MPHNIRLKVTSRFFACTVFICLGFSTTALGDLFDDFEDGDFTSDPTWIITNTRGDSVVDADPLRPGNLALKIHGSGDGTRTLRSYPDHPWLGFEFSYEVHATALMNRSDYLNDTASSDYFLRFDLIHDGGSTSTFRVFQQGTEFIHNSSFVGIPDEWWKVDAWHDVGTNLIHAQVSEIATGSILSQTVFSPNLDLSVPTRRIDEVVLSVRPTTWGYYDNISLNTVPEPTSAIILILMLPGMCRRRNDL